MHESRASSPLPAELFAQIKTIQLRAQRLVTDMMMGEYESAFKGRGMEFEKVREYQPGDDVRHIDWNVTARMQSAYVKEYREERELTVMLVVDVSASGSFGSARKLKNEVAAEVAAVLAYTAVKSNDRVGLIIFSDRIEHYIPPKKGRAHVWRVIRDILAFKPQGRGTDVEGALDYLGRVVRRRSVSFIISDFLDSPLAERLRITARRHELTAVSVVDPREEALPPVGLLELEDAGNWGGDGGGCSGPAVCAGLCCPGGARSSAVERNLARRRRGANCYQHARRLCGAYRAFFSPARAA